MALKLKHLVNEAALDAVKQGHDHVTMRNIYPVLEKLKKREELKNYIGLAR